MPVLRIVGLIPAAGASVRMGRPKLTLGLGHESVIQRVVRALESGGAETVVVIAPPITQQGAVVLANHARVQGAFVEHCPNATSDMRATVEFGLDVIQDAALAPDAILLCPGDSPGMSIRLVRQVVALFERDPTRVVVPRYRDRGGHPIAIPWEVALRIPDLPAGLGINSLLRDERSRVEHMNVDDEGAVADMDTLQDYARWQHRS